MPRTSAADLGSFEVPLPPLAEQRRVVGLMRQLDETLALSDAATRRVFELVRTLRESWFERLWKQSLELRPLGELVHRVRRPIDVLAGATYSEIGLRSHGRGIFHKESVAGADLGSKNVFGIESGDLVLNIVFAWERAVAVAGPQDAGRCGSHRFPTYRPREGVDIDYVCQALLANRGASLLGLASPGSAGRNRTLSQESLLKSAIPLPSLTEQERLVGVLAAARDAAHAHERHREAVARLRMSLLADLLSGDHEIPVSYDRFLDGAA
jgi:type I restriction enzyme S subunit